MTQSIGTVSTDDGEYPVRWEASNGLVEVLYRGQWVACGQARIDAEEALLVAKDHVLQREVEELKRSGAGGCVIATACLGDARVAPLRKLRDDAILSDPVARDFFHVFWSRYYEWSPGVARIAAADPAVARHIEWGFLDPWLAWLELATIVGRRKMSDLSDAERREVLGRLGARLQAWLAELPALMESKRPADSEAIYAAFERFRATAQTVFAGQTSDRPIA